MMQVLFEPEIRTLGSAAGAALFEQGFAMSYYALEKALPLTYLYRMNPVHSDYLDIAVTRRHRERRETLPWNELMTTSHRSIGGTDRAPPRDRYNARTIALSTYRCDR